MQVRFGFLCWIFEELTKNASGSKADALALFASEPTAVGPTVGKWAFVPAADILLTVGEGIVGITLEGAFVIDSRKRKGDDIWASLNLPFSNVDPDVKRLVEDFGIDDPQGVRSLVMY